MPPSLPNYIAYLRKFMVERAPQIGMVKMKSVASNFSGIGCVSESLVTISLRATVLVTIVALR